MKKIFFAAAIFIAALSAPVVSHAQMYDVNGNLVSFAYPVGVWGTNYVTFPSEHDSIYKSQDSIHVAIWASTEQVSIDTMKGTQTGSVTHKNYLLLPTPYNYVNGTPTLAVGNEVDISAHTFDSVRNLYLQYNGAVFDTLVVAQKNQRCVLKFSGNSNAWERYPK